MKCGKNVFCQISQLRLNSEFGLDLNQNVRYIFKIDDLDTFSNIFGFQGKILNVIIKFITLNLIGVKFCENSQRRNG